MTDDTFKEVSETDIVILHVPRYELRDGWPWVVFAERDQLYTNSIIKACEHTFADRLELHWPSTIAYADANTQPTTETL